MAISPQSSAVEKRISAIKRCTDDKIVYETLLTFTPKPAKYETLGDLFRNIEKEQKNKTESGGEVKEETSGTFQTALQILGRKKQTTLGDFFSESGDAMGEKKNRDLKTLFGDESDEEESKKVESEASDHDRKEKKRKHEDKHKRQDKKQKVGESSIDKEYEKFVEAVENSSSNVEKRNEQNGETSNKAKKNKLKKTEIGNLVVKLLTPAYVERRFESRDTFKNTARNISHALIDKDENEIKEYVENFLKKNDEITSQTVL